MDEFDQVRRVLSEGGVIAMTGAGISQESGIPTFRGKGGLWEEYPPEDFATPDGLMKAYSRDLPRLARFVRSFYAALIKAEPHGAHRELARMEKEGTLIGVITQNIDGLHTQAGSKKVMELHGNAWRLHCPRCAKTSDLSHDELRCVLGYLEPHFSRWKALKALSRFFKKCGCGNRMRIDIVLFSEPLPADVWQEAWFSLERAKTFLLAGTSGVVYPAASLAFRARQLGKRIIEVNLERSSLSGIADHCLLGKASEVMAELARR